jgi:hypothetical protein
VVVPGLVVAAAMLGCGGGGGAAPGLDSGVIVLVDSGKDAPRADGRSAASHDARSDAPRAGDAGAEDATTDAAITDGGSDAPAPDDAPYPAFQLAVPKVIDYGGPRLTSGVFVPILFPNDPLATPIQSFMAAIGGSVYWSTVTSEYGVGPATSTAPIVEATAPADNITDPEIQMWLAQQIASDPRFATPDAGAADGGITQYAYVLFYPEATTITSTGLGESCVGYGGYHYSFALPSGETAVYAVIPRCAMFNGLTGLDALTATLSHELIESATDPDPFHPALLGTDLQHYAWELVLGDGEVGDMCSFVPTADFKPAEAALSAFTVQRTWSNNAATAGLDPCVPPVGEPVYFSTVPAVGELTFEAQGQPYMTLGTTIPLGQTAIVTLDLASTGPIAPWSVQLEDYGAAFDNPAGLDLQIVGASSGGNGTELQVQVKTLTVGSANLYGLLPYFIYSNQGNAWTFWVGVVGN